ncbi:MAG: high frequency lysogenization protein HflD [Kistimonas sp.]|nr:high frequency lysogenization protein HflD [Kistimonas sp.]
MRSSACCEQDQVMSLAAVLQACSLVEKIATTGTGASQLMETAIESLFITDPDQVADVYGSEKKLEHGLRCLQALLCRDRRVLHSDTVRYAFALMHMEAGLRKNDEMLKTLARGIERAHTQLTYFHCLHDNVMASLADLYLATISTFRPRIQVKGRPQWLHNNAPCTNRIRACLLAGLRSAVLWRQVGGRRWHLAFSRRKLLATSSRLLAEIEPEVAGEA